MINFEALFQISYGLYIVSSGNKDHGNGFISNTVFQVTAEPPRFAACCNKNNFTSGFITKTGAFSVSVLHKDASPDLFGRFGFRSGRDLNKLEGIALQYGETGVPIVLNDCVAFLECKVVQTVDVGTHLMYIGELLHADVIGEGREPLTYLDYRQIRKGFSPKNAPTYIDKSKLASKPLVLPVKKYRCITCGYVYDEGFEGKKFIELPDNWVCPTCGSEKEYFIEIIN
jgi:flavin reductase (DIM6/NTAB) family NADH-FMN oxidoreductase RutF/rubredoxin